MDAVELRSEEPRAVRIGPAHSRLVPRAPRHLGGVPAAPNTSAASTPRPLAGTRKILGPILLGLGLLLPGPAPAQWRVAVYGGWADSFESDVRVDDRTSDTALRFEKLRFETRSFETPLYYGLRGGGYSFRSRLGVELELIHLKVFALVDRAVLVSGRVSGESVSARTAAEEFMERLDVSHGLNMILGNVFLRLPVGREGDGPAPAALTGRLGLGPTLTHTEAVVLDASAEHYESGGVAAQVAVGAEIRLWEGLRLIGEYKYTSTRQHLTARAVELEFAARTHHLTTGLQYGL